MTYINAYVYKHVYTYVLNMYIRVCRYTYVTSLKPAPLTAQMFPGMGIGLVAAGIIVAVESMQSPSH